jgi:hypothetical protein
MEEKNQKNSGAYSHIIRKKGVQTFKKPKPKTSQNENVRRGEILTSSAHQTQQI